VITKGTKNISSDRVIKLPDYMFSVLKEYKAWQNAIRLKIGDYWKENIILTLADGKKETVKNDRIFTQEDGTPIFPDSLTKWVNDFQKENNLPKFTPHTLRHTNISLLIAAGVPLRNVSQRAGHSQLSTTSNIYAHAIKTVDEIAAEAIGDALNPDKFKKL
jgi:integrase